MSAAFLGSRLAVPSSTAFTTITSICSAHASAAARTLDTKVRAKQFFDDVVEKMRAGARQAEALERKEPKIHEEIRGKAMRGNISKHVELEFGDVEKALASADVVVASHLCRLGTYAGARLGGTADTGQAL